MTNAEIASYFEAQGMAEVHVTYSNPSKKSSKVIRGKVNGEWVSIPYAQAAKQAGHVPTPRAFRATYITSDMAMLAGLNGVKIRRA